MATYSRSTPSPLYHDLVAEYRRMHVEGELAHHIPPEQTYAGISLPRHAVSIKMLIDKYRARTLLDYGSGKGHQYGPMNVQLPGGARYDSIPAYWGIDELYCYDPAHAPFSKPPAGKFDGVICTDVLEHCAEDDIPWIIEELFQLARRFLFANVACYSARAQLNNGQNAHCTVRDRNWWQTHVSEAAARFADVRYQILLDEPVPTPGGGLKLASAALAG